MDQSYVFLLVAFVCSFGSAHIPPVPCPRHFRYILDPHQNIEGLITVPYDGSSELQLSANASMKGFFGKDNSNMRLSMLTAPGDLIQGLTPNIDYQLQFPVQEAIPQITSIIFNYQQLCSGPPVPHSNDTIDLHASYTYSLRLPIPKRLKRGHITAGLLDRKDIPDEGNPYFYPVSYGFYDDSVYFEDHVLYDDEDTNNSFYDYSREQEHLVPMHRAAN